MSLLFDALKRAQQSVRNIPANEPQGIAPADQSPAASSAADRPTTNPLNHGGVNAARSIMSATARTERRVSPLLIGILLVLIAGGLGGWYYLQFQLNSTSAIAASNINPAPVAAPIAQETTPEVIAAAPTAPPAPVIVKHKPFYKTRAAKHAVHSRQPRQPVEDNTSATPATSSTPAVAKPVTVSYMSASVDMLKEAYTALTEGRLADAQAKYQAVIAERPHEKDALLGLAVIAQRQKQTERALDYYQQVLSEDPNNIIAATALFSLSEQADPVAAESRLKQLLELKPSAPEPYYALGNVQARQHRWGEAQQSFFRAYSLKPDKALYAFNLAVALDHLHKTASALTYYEKASQLAQQGDSTVNRTAIQQRVLELNNPSPAEHLLP